MNSPAQSHKPTDIQRCPRQAASDSVLRLIDAESVSETASREVRNREIHLPPVSVYRWWARRSEAIFGSILDAFSQAYGPDALVADPFAGGGVIPLAAILRGFRVYAQDLNPWAVKGMAAMLRLPSAAEIRRLARTLQEAAAPVLQAAYETVFSDGEPAALSHTFRVATAMCSVCGTRNRLFPHALISLLVRKERNRPEAVLACPRGHMFFGNSQSIKRCPACGVRTDPTAVYTSERTVACWSCGHTEKLQARAHAGEWSWEVVLVERSTRQRREIALATTEEIEQAKDTQWHLLHDLGPIPAGQETRVLLRHGFRRWQDLYPMRQLAVMEDLLRLSEQITADERSRMALRMSICGTAEMAGLLSRWDRWYLKSYEAMAGHRFNFTTFAAEPNVWGATGSGRGTVERRLALFAKASAWLSGRLGRELSTIGPEPSSGVRVPIPDNADAYIVEGSSERMRLKAKSADLILTDPPYHDDVQYDELSLPLRAWAQLSTDKLANEAVVNVTAGATPGDYRALMTRLFRECRRILKPAGRLIFSYANREPEAWIDIFTALQGAGFYGLAYTILHSENETDHAKRGVRACALDLIMELTPQEHHIGQFWPAAQTSGPEGEFLAMVGETFLSVGTLDGPWETEFSKRLKASHFLSGPSRKRDQTSAA